MIQSIEQGKSTSFLIASTGTIAAVRRQESPESGSP